MLILYWNKFRQQHHQKSWRRRCSTTR